MKDLFESFYRCYQVSKNQKLGAEQRYQEYRKEWERYVQKNYEQKT